MTSSTGDRLELRYGTPATYFTEALPIGNGSLGAMVYGGVDTETLQLNHDTLWSGGPKDYTNPQARAHLPEVRRLLFSGRFAEAEALCKKMQGPYTQSYMPMANVRVTFSHAGDVNGYSRALSLDNAVARVEYQAGGVAYVRETFASHPAESIVMKMSADREGALSCVIDLRSKLRFQVAAKDASDGLSLEGTAPAQVNPEYHNRGADGRPFGPDKVVRYEDGKGLSFVVLARVATEGGTVRVGGEQETPSIIVENATTACLYLTAATNFVAWNEEPVRELARSRAFQSMESCSVRGFEELMTEHVADYRELFDRVTFELGKTKTDPLRSDNTTERIRSFGDSGDPAMVELLFQYGRYLLISSSRPGTQAANLQGIWNEEVRPPWSSNWTININTEMNYWPAMTANLAECHKPLLAMIANLAESGKSVAETNYGCRGWTAHHNTDLWMLSCPVGDYGHGNPRWSMWPMAGAWLSQHLWEHYAFSLDEAYLRNQAYPIMRGAAEFCLDWLVEDSEGSLVTAPSTSPEHGFMLEDGKIGTVSVATTADIAMIHDLFTNCIEANALLEIDDDFRAALEEARARLKKPVVGSKGQLGEWFKDWDDEDPRHRHHSHLFGLHPGRQITRGRTPELFDAARRTMEIRGDESTGWSLAWKVALWARLGDGDRAYRILKNILRLVPSDPSETAGGGHHGGVYANLLGAHPPYQIDGNFGITAAVCELLVQSHTDRIELLPALPKDWPNGRFAGIRARGAVTIDLSWGEGRLRKATLTSAVDQDITVVADGEERRVALSAGVPVEIAT